MTEEGTGSRCDEDVVFPQVAAVLREIAQSLADDPDQNRQRANVRAFMRTQSEAILRHEHLSYMFATWLAERADRATPKESVQAALDAAEAHGSDVPLARDLTEFVAGYCDGSISDDEFVRRLRKPRASSRPRPATKRQGAPSEADGISLAEALIVLAEMITEAGVDRARPDAAALWKVFKAFAERPVAATSPAYVENDMCFFQWGAYDWGDGRHFEWDLTRQFVIHDEDGDYDHMEQIHVTLLFDADDPRFTPLGSGDLWSGPDLRKWASEIETLDPFLTITASGVVASEVRLRHEEV